MKILKIILFSFVVLIFLAVIGLFVFLKTFDVQKLKPQIVKSASDALGRQVDFSAIALKVSLRDGIALNLKGLRIAEDSQFQSGDFMNIENIFLNIDILSSLKKRQFLVSDIRIHSPKLTIIRAQDGSVNVQQLGGPTVSDSGQAAVAVPLFFVRRVTIENGTAVYIDRSFSPEITLPIDKLDIQIDRLSLKEPFPFVAQAAILSSQKNIRAKGSMQLDMTAGTFRIFNVEADGDVAKLAPDKIIAALPMFKDAGLENGFQGKFNVSVKEAVFAEKGMMLLSAQAKLSNGSLKLRYLALPLGAVNAAVDMTQQEINITDISLRLGGGTIKGTGTIKDYIVSQQYNFGFKMDNVDLRQIIGKEMFPAEITGLISGNATLQGRGFDPLTALATLQGQGGCTLKDAALGYNILEDVLNKITLIPGLINRVLLGLPAEWRNELTKKRTVLAHAEIRFILQDSTINFPFIRAGAQGFNFAGSGWATLDQNISIAGQFAISDEMTRKMVASVPELQYLMNESNMLEIPIKISGKAPSIGLSVDLKYIGNKLLQQKAKEQIGRFLDKVFKQEKE